MAASSKSTKFTFELSAELREVMDAHPEVNWSAVLRDAVRRHAEAVEMAERIVEEQNDPRVRAVAEGLKRGAAERFRRAGEATDARGS